MYREGKLGMNLRPIPMISTILICSALLFGGWFIYENTAVKSPIEEAVQAIPGIAESDIQLDRNSINLSLQLSEGAQLRTVYEEVSRKSNSVAGNRSVTIDLQDESSDELDQWWSEALFDVAQAMETRRYGDIPNRLEVLAAGKDGFAISTEMDNHNVYIHLSEGKYNKYIVLPRTPIELGVWNNESI